jgi:hypothetical protein
MKLVIVLPLAVVLIAPAVGARAATADFSYDGTLARGQRLEVRNISGTISVTNGPSLAIRARRTAEHGDPNAVKILVEPAAFGMRVCVRYPSEDQTTCGGSGGHFHRDDASNNDTHVDLTIRIPSGTNLDVASVSGSVDARTDGAIAASTVSGNVNVDGNDVVKANAVNGNVNVRLHPSRDTAHLKIATVSGNVGLDLAPGVRAVVSAHALSGTITGLGDVDRPQYGPGESAVQTFGSAGRRIDVDTVSGSIRVTHA